MRITKEEKEAHEVAGWWQYARAEREGALVRLVHGLLDPAWLEQSERHLTSEQRARREDERGWLKANVIEGGRAGLEELKVTCWRPHPAERSARPRKRGAA